MFDIGFIEMLVVAIVALLVLGPERLPGAVRTAGLTIGRIKRGFADVRSQVEREIGADEIRQQLHNERIMSNLEKSGKQGKQDGKPEKPARPDPGAPVADPKVTDSNVKRAGNTPVTSTEQTAPTADTVATLDGPTPSVDDTTDDSPTRPDER
ncbi:Sec-independent protein translocase protein TatB [Pseudomonas sp. OIL-1]|uniref:Sec-independent protein translocase protein TatB n=1 Tax=Pseudomonas sp. OIL-1 TaxID=2706126 RepID=UPI0013A71B76|nr:Sec-independent protein translocase protein TatB [Pseudomonas sp. OIL-1]QIB50632.1 twin-arginine translocase subunit TatB [Pseudomonas sp. OIL-1]